MPFTVVFISTIKFMKLFNHFVIESVPHSIFCLTEPNRNDTRYKHVCYKRWNAFLFCDVFFYFSNIHFRYMRIFRAKICFISCMWVSIKNDLLSYHIISLFFNTRASAIHFVVSLERKMCKHFRLRVSVSILGWFVFFFPSSLFVCVVSDLWLNL